MISGQKIIAFTPCGRKRYMDLLTAHVVREHEAGHIDEWLLFNNAYSIEDSTYAAQLAAHFPWMKVLNQAKPGVPEHIADFFKFMTEGDGVLYLRLDDDIVYIDPTAIPRLVKYRLENPHPFLVYPTIINNVRTSYHLQQAGIVSKSWAGEIKNEMCDPIAWREGAYVFNLHQKALNALEHGTLVEEFTLPSETFTDWEAGHISINCFVTFGKDLLACNVPKDEEGYLSLWRPKELNRQNARAGDAMVIHFAYHTQTEFMDKSGMLGDYWKFAPPTVPFRTIRLSPEFPKGGTSEAPRPRVLTRGTRIRPNPMPRKPFTPKRLHERYLQRLGLKA